MSPTPDRAHDIVVYGASGFVGRLTAAYLAEHAPADARIALGGRSRERLEAVRATLGPAAASWPVVVADSADPEALAAMAADTRAVATTVGPYLRYGLPLVGACAAAGTHYADLTGEVLFMRKAIDAHHASAMESGARIVHTCGFDSIPSDLGVFLLAAAASDGDLGELTDATYVLKGSRGGVSGGTVDSLRGQLDEAKRDGASRRLLTDPYSLSPDRDAEPDLGPQRDPVGVVRDDALGGFLAPFAMGTINTRVVRRSNALSGYAYGSRLRYRELMLAGGLPLGPVKAAAIAGGIGALMAGLAIPPTRKVLDHLLPDPGEGPSEKNRERGFFAVDVHGTTSSGARLVCRIRAQGDPGYKATAVMLGESALALALDGDALPKTAGVLTPATAMGHVLVDRLRAAGQTYEVEQV
ncbi:Putative trans-acting enoyl reductase [Paraconexibacter sp. AEG42_29]|uniref:Trans-acting enoyl reductase n=1 Tax=Paraconexibacter sp. AEG42_29 TaxID=2997339 RepID=A0AAU7AXV0_9ACTN